MNGSLLRGRLLVRIQSGSPKTPLKYSLFTGLCAEACAEMQAVVGYNGQISVQNLWGFASFEAAR